MPVCGGEIDSGSLVELVLTGDWRTSRLLVDGEPLSGVQRIELSLAVRRPTELTIVTHTQGLVCRQRGRWLAEKDWEAFEAWLNLAPGK